MRVRWTTDAADDLERICDYVAETSPDAARRVAKTIVEGVASLRTFPNRGRPGPGRRHSRVCVRGNRARTFDRAVSALLLSQSQEWVSTRRSSRRQIGGGHRHKHQRRQGDADTGWVLWTQPEQH
jgi:plasmid stabilization system protein ParE